MSKTAVSSARVVDGETQPFRAKSCESLTKRAVVLDPGVLGELENNPVARRVLEESEKTWRHGGLG